MHCAGVRADGGIAVIVNHCAAVGINGAKVAGAFNGITGFVCNKADGAGVVLDRAVVSLDLAVFIVADNGVVIGHDRGIIAGTLHRLAVFIDLADRPVVGVNIGIIRGDVAIIGAIRQVAVVLADR